MHWPEAGGFGRARHGGGNPRVLHLRHRAAGAADQELHRMMVRFARVGAADECVEALDLMDKSMILKEIQRAIHRGRRGVGLLGLQQIEQRIRAERLA